MLAPTRSGLGHLYGNNNKMAPSHVLGVFIVANVQYVCMCV